MIDPNYYLFVDLSITEIEGPAEFYDWETEREIVDHMYDWKSHMEDLIQDAIDSAPADDLSDELVELEDPNNLMGW